MRFLPLKEMKTRGAAIGSLLTGMFPEATLHRASKAWSVHRASSCMAATPPVTQREDSIRESKNKTKKITPQKNTVCGDKEREESSIRAVTEDQLWVMRLLPGEP